MSGGAKVLLAILILIAAGWYFLVYDSPAGRCNRGDLGACFVALGQQAQREARASTPTPLPAPTVRPTPTPTPRPTTVCMAAMTHVVVTVRGEPICPDVLFALNAAVPGKWRPADAVPAGYITGQICWYSPVDRLPLEADFDGSPEGEAATLAICRAFSP